MKPTQFSRLSVLAAICLAFAGLSFARDRGEGPLDPAPPKGVTAQEIIQKFAAREKEFEIARDNYTYRQSVKVQTLDGDTVSGEYQQTFDVLFDDKGRRIISVVYSPPSTLEKGGLIMSSQDFQDIERLQPCVLTTEELPEYDVTYLGQQREDELNTYLFEIHPKQTDKKKRRFQGKVWVDDRDFQIVKVLGNGVAEANFDTNNEQQFP